MNKLQTINGYKILTIPVSDTNIIYVQSYILSGRMNEGKTTSGISHLLEHILTESWKKCKNDCAKYWGKKGIITNASTGDTTVNYYVEGLDKNYKDLIEYIVKITTAPLLNKSRIEVEKKAVKEELKREMNDPGWKIAHKISNIFFTHAGLQNGNNIPLQIDNLKNLNMGLLQKYCKNIYTPKNILFIVSGDFRISSILNIFKKFLPKNPSMGKKNIKTNILKKISRPSTHFIKNANSKVAEIVVSFFSKIYLQDIEALYFSLIIDILSGGMHSLLMRKLRTERHLIYNINIYMEPEITGTLTTIETTGNQENVVEIVKTIKSVLNDFINGNWGDEHMVRIKDRYLIKDEKICKNNIFLGDYYGEQYLTQLYKKRRTIRSIKQKNNIIKQVTKKDIISTAKKTFPLNQMITVYQCKNKQRF